MKDRFSSIRARWEGLGPWSAHGGHVHLTSDSSGPVAQVGASLPRVVGAIAAAPADVTFLTTLIVQLMTEIDVLRGSECGEGGDGVCGVCLKCVREISRKETIDEVAQLAQVLVQTNVDLSSFAQGLYKLAATPAPSTSSVFPSVEMYKSQETGQVRYRAI
jgi:hypothetical protein